MIDFKYAYSLLGKYARLKADNGRVFTGKIVNVFFDEQVEVTIQTDFFLVVVEGDKIVSLEEIQRPY